MAWDQLCQDVHWKCTEGNRSERQGHSYDWNRSEKKRRGFGSKGTGLRWMSAGVRGAAGEVPGSEKRGCGEAAVRSAKARPGTVSKALKWQGKAGNCLGKAECGEGPQCCGGAWKRDGKATCSKKTRRTAGVLHREQRADARRHSSDSRGHC